LTIFFLYAIAKKINLLGQVFLAFFIQFLIGFFLLFTSGLNYDARTYHLAAIGQSKLWRGEQPSAEIMLNMSQAIVQGKELFTWFLGLLYFVLGNDPGLAIILNSFFMGVVVLVLSQATHNFNFSDSQKITAWLSSIAPPFLIWSPFVSREALNFMLLSLVVFASSLIFKRQLHAGIIVYFILFLCFLYSRAQLTLVVLASLTAVTILSPFSLFLYRKNRENLKSWVLLFSNLVMMGLILVFLKDYFLSIKNYIPLIIRSNSNPENSLSIVREESVGNYINSPIDSGQKNEVLSGFENLNSVMWGPFPWNWIDFKFFVAGLDGIGYLFIWIIILMNLLAIKRFRFRTLILLIPIIPLIIGATVTLANYGIIMRVRAHFIPFVIPILAVSLRHRKDIMLLIHGKLTYFTKTSKLKS
jgi:hypothetical protein